MKNYLFPFGKVPPNSDIVLYGAGNVGQQFYSQIQQTQYCNIIKWIDQKFISQTSSTAILSSISSINTISYDYIVIAIDNPTIAREISKNLQKHSIPKGKIIYQNNYEQRRIKLPFNNDFLLEHDKEMLDILNTFFLNVQQFGEGNFYQSFSSIGIKGQRPTYERLHHYGILPLLKSNYNVLDIGCNCGFLDMQISQKVHHVTGIEFNKSLVVLANKMKNILDYKNCTFLNQDFTAWKTTDKYDVIFAFSIIGWLNLTSAQFTQRITQLLNPSGYLLIESHNTNSIPRLELYRKCINHLIELNFSIINTGTICDDNRIIREFCILQKNS